MVVVHGVRVTGPLAPYAEGLAGELARLGFKPSSARLQMQVAAHLSRRMPIQKLGPPAKDYIKLPWSEAKQNGRTFQGEVIGTQKAY